MKLLLSLLLLFSSTAFAIAPDYLDNVGLATSFSGNAMTIRLKTARGNDPSGADPVTLAFRSSTSASGTFLTRKVTSAVSTVVSSGSTGGCAASVECEYYVYALDNAGTIELAWSTSYWSEELQSTTAEGGAGAADTTTVLYSTTARSAKAVRLLGVIYVTQTTPGTHVTSPSKIRLMPFGIELGERFVGGIIISGGGSNTTTGTVTTITTAGATFQPQGQGSQVGSDVKVRIAAGLKPGAYRVAAQFNVWAQSAIATACEVYGVMPVGGFGYAQISQSNATADGPLFGVHFSGVRIAGSYVGQNADFYLNWRRVAGSGSCNYNSGSGDSAYIYVYRSPYVNGQAGRL